jgi:flagellar hook-associated protein 2
VATTISSATSSTANTATASSGSTAAKTTTTSSTTTASSAKTAAQKLVTSLGAGSGVDLNSLAQNLVDAEFTPQKAAINDKITKNNSRTSGYAAVSYVLSQVKTAFTALKARSSYDVVSATSNDNTSFTLTSGTSNATSLPGRYSVNVANVAQPQITQSVAFGPNVTSFNDGQAMSVSLTVGGKSTSIDFAAGEAAPQTLVDRINAANSGVTAQLVDLGDGSTTPYQIVLTGPDGSKNGFSINMTPSGLAFNAPSQDAKDAQVTVNGVTYVRDSNQISDVLPGININLLQKSTATATVTISRDTSSVTTNLQSLVTAYNDAVSMLNVVTDPKSTVDTYGATLVNDSTVRYIRNQLRSLFTTAFKPPAGSSPKITSLQQLGVSIDRTGVMSLDTTKLSSVLSTNFKDVVQSLTANSENTVVPAAGTTGGIAGDAVKSLTDLLSTQGIVQRQTTNATNQNTKYQEQLTTLQTRMDAALKRYQTQFAAMDSLVGNVNSQKTSLKSAFDGMMSIYTNKN